MISSWICGARSKGRNASNGSKIALPKRCGAASLSMMPTVAYGAGEAPLIEPTRKMHQKLMAEGCIQEAMALQAAVTHNVWCASRASEDPLLMQCPRCGGETETLLHRFWTCPNYCAADHPAIRGTQHLIPDAVAGCESNSPFWLGCFNHRRHAQRQSWQGTSPSRIASLPLTAALQG